MIGLLHRAPDEIQPFPAFPLPLACIRGMKEVVKPVIATEVRRTIRGESVALPAPWAPKAGFRLTNAGPGVLVPPDNYLPVGQQAAFASSRPHMRIIQGGASLITLSRRVVPGSVHATDDVGNPISADEGPVLGGQEPFSIVVPSAPAFAFVHFRLIYDCLIVGLSEISSDYTGRDVGWTIELEEQYAR